MPELAELHEMSRTINTWGKKRRVMSIVKADKHKSENIPFPDAWKRTGASVFAVSRGKELLLCVGGAKTLQGKKLKTSATSLVHRRPTKAKLVADGTSQDVIDTVFGVGEKRKKGASAPIGVLFTMGMSGTWRTFSPGSELHKHAHLRFEGDDGSVLALVDVRRFSRWKIFDGGSPVGFSPTRGPDPVKEPDAFAAAIEAKRESKVFEKPVMDVILNQKYFNGIGNYLRAEILHRGGISPFETLNSVLASPKGPEFLSLCTSIPTEAIVIKQGPTVKGRSRSLRKWRVAYGKLHSVRDKAGRTMWFDSSIHPVPEEYADRLGKGRVRGVRNKNPAPQAEDDRVESEGEGEY